MALENKHLASKATLKKGDHLFFDKAFGLPGLSHHGVYVGNNQVIHFWPRDEHHQSVINDEAYIRTNTVLDEKQHAVVHVVPFEDFESQAAYRGSRVYVVDHQKRLPRDETVACCISKLNKRGYCSITNNCEHMVNECVIGENRSLQVDAMYDQYKQTFKS